MVVYIERGCFVLLKAIFLSAQSQSSRRYVWAFSSLLVACWWGLGVFSDVGVRATLGTMLGILLATAIGTALMALAVYSDQSGHDEAIFRVEKEPGSVQDPER